MFSRIQNGKSVISFPFLSHPNWFSEVSIFYLQSKVSDYHATQLFLDWKRVERYSLHLKVVASVNGMHLLKLSVLHQTRSK